MPPPTRSATEHADTVARLRAAGCVYAEDEADLLIAAATDTDHLAALVGRRTAGTPLEQLLGYADFCGVRVRLRPGVFVPRARTALLVAQAVAALPAGGTLVDLCCGSGALGAAVAARVPRLNLHAADVDAVAVACARDNLRPHGGQAHHGDLYAALPAGLRGTVDVLLANVPYVPSGHVALLPPEARLHEPRVALDGGADGLDVLRRVAADAPAWLAPGGRVLLETTARQVPAALAALTAAGLLASTVTDDDLDATAVSGQRPAPVSPGGAPPHR